MNSSKAPDLAEPGNFDLSVSYVDNAALPITSLH